jgi:hypothetical protein
MCEQCDKLQREIDRYHRLMSQLFDPLTKERFKVAVTELEERKAKLH